MFVRGFQMLVSTAAARTSVDLFKEPATVVSLIDFFIRPYDVSLRCTSFCIKVNDFTTQVLLN